MRITGGVLGGRRLLAPAGNRVRPTQDVVRAALFSALGTRVAGCRFLDLFAGSGAVGLDAWSRGARFVCWVEADRRAFGVLQENVLALCGPDAGDRARTVRADALRFLAAGSGGAPYDVAFADPPYDPPERGDWLAALAEALARGATIAPDGLWVMETGRRCACDPPPGWALARDRTYGETRLLVLRKETESKGACNGGAA